MYILLLMYIRMHVCTLHMCMFSIVRTSKTGTVTNETARSLEPIIQVSIAMSQ